MFYIEYHLASKSVMPVLFVAPDFHNLLLFSTSIHEEMWLQITVLTKKSRNRFEYVA
jgi:hypothetical protein